jgi:hypothetical protein
VRRILLFAAASWAIAQGTAAAQSLTNPLGTEEKPIATCGHYGTSVDFESSPSEAGRKARQEEKLLFILHVSGHFEDPKFT